MRYDKKEICDLYEQIEAEERVKRETIRKKIEKLEAQYEASEMRPILQELYKPDYGNKMDFITRVCDELKRREQARKLQAV